MERHIFNLDPLEFKQNFIHSFQRLWCGSILTSGGKKMSGDALYGRRCYQMTPRVSFPSAREHATEAKC